MDFYVYDKKGGLIYIFYRYILIKIYIFRNLPSVVAVERIYNCTASKLERKN